MKPLALLCISLSVAAPAYAAPPPISPSLPIPGLDVIQKGRVINSAMTYMRDALERARLDPTRLSRPELQCMAARFVAGGARALLLLEELGAAKLESAASPAQLQGLRNAIAYLEALEQAWCGGSGGSTPRVEKAISDWRAAQNAQAKSLIDRMKSAARELDGKPAGEWTAAEWALVAAIIAAAMASGATPSPL
jgi:hypothetical protein